MPQRSKERGREGKGAEGAKGAPRSLGDRWTAPAQEPPPLAGRAPQATWMGDRRHVLSSSTGGLETSVPSEGPNGRAFLRGQGTPPRAHFLSPGSGGDGAAQAWLIPRGWVSSPLSSSLVSDGLLESGSTSGHDEQPTTAHPPRGDSMNSDHSARRLPVRTGIQLGREVQRWRIPGETGELRGYSSKGGPTAEWAAGTDSETCERKLATHRAGLMRRPGFRGNRKHWVRI